MSCKEQFQIGDLITTIYYCGIGIVIDSYQDNLKVYWCKKPVTLAKQHDSLTYVSKKKCKHITKLEI
jgi:hypothetical protein